MKKFSATEIEKAYKLVPYCLSREINYIIDDVTGNVYDEHYNLILFGELVPDKNIKEIAVLR